MDAKKFNLMRESLRQSLQIREDMKAGKKITGVRISRREAPPTPQEVKALRVTLHLNQVKFADAVGESPSAVQSWEQGKRRPSGSASRLMRILGNHPKLVKELV